VALPWRGRRMHTHLLVIKKPLAAAVSYFCFATFYHPLHNTQAGWGAFQKSEGEHATRIPAAALHMSPNAGGCYQHMAKTAKRRVPKDQTVVILSRARMMYNSACVFGRQPRGSDVGEAAVRARRG
jgi:hypothetical protein